MSRFSNHKQVAKELFRGIRHFGFSRSTPYIIYNYLSGNLRILPRKSNYVHTLANIAAEGIEEVSDDDMSKISDFEWENLVILDACRSDLYEEVRENPNEFRYTSGSGTGQYINANFAEGNFDDVVYITSNPQFAPSKFKDHCGRELDDVFHTVFHSWEKGFEPEHAIEDLKTAEKLFPEKRKIIHLIPPHIPFLQSEKDIEGNSWWKKSELGLLDDEMVWKEYKKNLELALNSLDEILGITEGRTLLTSDHGNYFGENGIYGHHSTRPSVPVRKVPLEVLRK